MNVESIALQNEKWGEYAETCVSGVPMAGWVVLAMWTEMSSYTNTDSYYDSQAGTQINKTVVIPSQNTQFLLGRKESVAIEARDKDIVDLREKVEVFEKANKANAEAHTSLEEQLSGVNNRLDEYRGWLKNSKEEKDKAVELSRKLERDLALIGKELGDANIRKILDAQQEGG